MFAVELSHIQGGIIYRETGLAWNEAQDMAAYYRRLLEKPRDYRVTITRQ